jgi:tRNA (guanine-N7-)-methyltransferase
LDIGCAKGNYLVELRNFDYLRGGYRCNYLGVELFAPLVVQANALEDLRSVGTTSVNGTLDNTRNLQYVHCNINLDLESLGIKNLTRVTYLFPDPWSCGPHSHTKNKKKRVMNQDFAERISQLLQVGGEFYFASDWLELAVEIKTLLMATGKFKIPDGEGGGMMEHIAQNPSVPTITARELSSYAVPDTVTSTLIDVQNDYGKPSEVEDLDTLWLKGIPFGAVTERD